MDKKSINWLKVYDYITLIAIPILGIAIGIYTAPDNASMINIASRCIVWSGIIFLSMVFIAGLFVIGSITLSNLKDCND